MSSYYGKTEAQIVKRFCKEEKITPEQALVALITAMNERHVDRALWREGVRQPWPKHNERAEALIPAMDALHERRHGDTPEAKTYELVFRLLTCCNMVSLELIDKETRPKMRLAGSEDDEDEGNDE